MKKRKKTICVPEVQITKITADEVREALRSEVRDAVSNLLSMADNEEKEMDALKMRKLEALQEVGFSFNIRFK